MSIWEQNELLRTSVHFGGNVKILQMHRGAGLAGWEARANTLPGAGGPALWTGGQGAAHPAEPALGLRPRDTACVCASSPSV